MRARSTGRGSTGKSRYTMRWSRGTATTGDSTRLGAGGLPLLQYVVIPDGPPFSSALLGASPHTMTNRLRNTHGIHARRTAPGPAAVVVRTLAPEAWSPDGGASDTECPASDDV